MSDKIIILDIKAKTYLETFKAAKKGAILHVTGREDLDALNLKQAVSIHNALAEDALVEKETTVEAARDELWELLGNPENMADIAVEVPTEEKAPVKKAEAKNAAATPVEPRTSGGRGRAAGPLDIKPGKPKGLRQNTKQAKGAALMMRKTGATIAQLAEAVGWAEGSIRGTLIRNDICITHGYGVEQRAGKKDKPDTFHLIMPEGQTELLYR